MKQNYFKSVCSLLWLVLPMLIMPLEVAAQEIIPNEEVAESLASVAPVEETEAIEAEVEALQEIVAAEEIAEQAVRSYTYTVYRDGVKIASGLTEPTFVDEDVPVGEHSYCVEVQYEEGVSDKVCVDVEVKDFKPVTNLTGTASNDEVTLDWDGVEEKADVPEDKAVSYNVYKNGALIGNTAETHYVETGVANGTYIYEVEVKYPDGVSPKVAVTVTVTNSSLSNVEGQTPYTLRVEGKRIIAETHGMITLYDINGRTVATALNRLEYMAQTGFYAVRFDVGNKHHVSKIQVR